LTTGCNNLSGRSLKRNLHLVYRSILKILDKRPIIFENLHLEQYNNWIWTFTQFFNAEIPDKRPFCSEIDQFVFSSRVYAHNARPRAHLVLKSILPRFYPLFSLKIVLNFHIFSNSHSKRLFKRLKHPIFPSLNLQ